MKFQWNRIKRFALAAAIGILLFTVDVADSFAQGGFAAGDAGDLARDRAMQRAATARPNGARTGESGVRTGTAADRAIVPNSPSFMNVKLPEGQHQVRGFVPAHERMASRSAIRESGYEPAIRSPLADSFGDAPSQIAQASYTESGPYAASAMHSIRRSSPSGRLTANVMFDDAEVIYEQGGDVIHNDGAVMYDDGAVVYDDGAWAGDSCCGDGCSGACGSSCGGYGGCASYCLPCLPCLPLKLENASFSGGVFGATGPRNFVGATPATRSGTGTFGFIEGVNWGAPIPCFSGLSMQVGANATQGNLSGAPFANDTRKQVFLTAGGFRRVDCGIQGGVVFDYLHDDWYSTLDLTQLRGELSWVYPGSHELGFWFATNLNRSTDVSVFGVGTAQRQQVVETWQATDLYAFFYRYRDPCTGGNGRLFAGFTGASDGLIGADMELPIARSIAVRGAFTYLVPEESRRELGFQQESWNVGVSLVWRPCGFKTGCSSYSNPLFNVADNGTFMLDRR